MEDPLNSCTPTATLASTSDTPRLLVVTPLPHRRLPLGSEPCMTANAVEPESSSASVPGRSTRRPKGRRRSRRLPGLVPARHPPRGPGRSGADAYPLTTHTCAPGSRSRCLRARGLGPLRNQVAPAIDCEKERSVVQVHLGPRKCHVTGAWRGRGGSGVSRARCDEFGDLGTAPRTTTASPTPGAICSGGSDST